MSLAVAIQMDPIEPIDIDAEVRDEVFELLAVRQITRCTIDRDDCVERELELFCTPASAAASPEVREGTHAFAGRS